MAKSLEQIMPQYTDVVEVRALPVTTRHQITRLRTVPGESWNIGRLQFAKHELVREPLLLGIGAVLVDAAGVWSPAVNLGTLMPETVDDAIIRVYGDQNSKDIRAQRSRAQIYSQTAAATDGLREEELLRQLQDVEPITARIIDLLAVHERPSWMSDTQTYHGLDRSAGDKPFGHTGIDTSRDGYLD